MTWSTKFIYIGPEILNSHNWYHTYVFFKDFILYYPGIFLFVIALTQKLLLSSARVHTILDLLCLVPAISEGTTRLTTK